MQDKYAQGHVRSRRTPGRRRRPQAPITGGCQVECESETCASLSIAAFSGGLPYTPMRCRCRDKASMGWSASCHRSGSGEPVSWKKEESHLELHGTSRWRVNRSS